MTDPTPGAAGDPPDRAGEQVAIPAGILARRSLEDHARCAVGGTIDAVRVARLRALGLLDATGEPVTALIPLGRTVADPIADLELRWASAGAFADVRGWWRPELTVLHATRDDPDEPAPYVLTSSAALPMAILHALAVPDRPAAASTVSLPDVAALLDAARTGGPDWAGQVGADRAERIAVHRWDIAVGGGDAAVVRAIVSAPDGLRVLRHTDDGPALVPTDLAAEELELASVTETLRRSTAG
ncbi:MAG: hypothetical protein JJT89_09295 [Nitriliruptoraceae bacterium]|nr:hypothetical protein [Nitriliruptoraceae bacterium]